MMIFKTLLPAALAGMLLSSPADATSLKYALSGPSEAVFYLDSMPTPSAITDKPKGRYVTFNGVPGTIKAFGKTVNVHYIVSMFTPLGDQPVWGMDIQTADYVGDLSWVEPGWYNNGFLLNSTDITPESAEQVWFDGPLQTPTLRSGIFSTKEWYGPPVLRKEFTITVTEVGGVSGKIVGSVPEPATWATMVIGFGAVGVGLRRRKRTGALQTA